MLPRAGAAQWTSSWPPRRLLRALCCCDSRCRSGRERQFPRHWGRWQVPKRRVPALPACAAGVPRRARDAGGGDDRDVTPLVVGPVKRFARQQVRGGEGPGQRGDRSPELEPSHPLLRGFDDLSGN